MAHSLGIAREAIIGYWIPANDPAVSPPKPKAFDKLTYLSEARRFEILSGELLSAFQVRKTAKGAALFVSTHGTDALSDGQSVTSTTTQVCSLEKPSNAQLRTQMIWVRNYAELRGDRIGEITDQTVSLLPFFGSVGLLNDARRRASWELLSLVHTLCIILEMRMKHFCWSPRPIDFAPEVQPIIQTPDHSTFPSGHATEAFAIATVLYHLMQKKRLKDFDTSDGDDGTKAPPPMLVRVAHRIAVNRTVAGVHFPVDSAAGAMLGTAIGEAVIGLAQGQALAQTGYGGSNALGSQDFTQSWFMANHQPKDANNTTTLELVAEAYKRAVDEW